MILFFLSASFLLCHYCNQTKLKVLLQISGESKCESRETLVPLSSSSNSVLQHHQHHPLHLDCVAHVVARTHRVHNYTFIFRTISKFLLVSIYNRYQSNFLIPYRFPGTSKNQSYRRVLLFPILGRRKKSMNTI